MQNKAQSYEWLVFYSCDDYKIRYGEIVRNSEDLRIGSPFQKWQKMSNVRFKTAQQFIGVQCFKSPSLQQNREKLS